MPTDRPVSSPAPGLGTPPRDESRLSDILHVEIGKLQNDGEHIKALLGEVRTDTKDVRDRLTRLEERVSHLPSKGFIIIVVTTYIAIGVALTTLLTALQSYVGQRPAVVAPAAPATPEPAKHK